LDEDQLGYYSDLEGGLLAAYGRAGFDVVHKPVIDHLVPPVPHQLLPAIYASFHAARKPAVVHCSAGIDRTGSVIDFIQFAAAVDSFLQDQEHGSVDGCLESRRAIRDTALQLYVILEPIHQLPTRFRTVLWAAAGLCAASEGRNPSSPAWEVAQMVMERRFSCRLASAAEIATVVCLQDTAKADDNGGPGKIYPPIASHWDRAGLPKELLIVSAILRMAHGIGRRKAGVPVKLKLHGNVVRETANGDRSKIEIHPLKTRGALLKALLGVEVAVSHVRAEEEI
jgi:hypothetical protein